MNRFPSLWIDGGLTSPRFYGVAMRVVLEIQEGLRIQDEDFYKQNSMWYNKYYKKHFKKGDKPTSHKELAKILEADYTPIAKFFAYLNSSEDHIGGLGIDSRFTYIYLKALMYSTNAEHCRINIQDDIWNEWHDYLHDNLGDFDTQNSTPLVDTVQYLKSIRFDVKYIGADRLNLNMLFKFYPTQQSRQELINNWQRDPEGILASMDKDTSVLGLWG